MSETNVTQVQECVCSADPLRVSIELGQNNLDQNWNVTVTNAKTVVEAMAVIREAKQAVMLLLVEPSPNVNPFGEPPTMSGEPPTAWDRHSSQKPMRSRKRKT